ncbi:hypothetical protein NA78x_002717 [Anatilimnocola sp. NA78]|uniref:hypothetical protein n=1 Tax=Anatilimnocola sp. NA78 TaxID=3415683 RepID=UPI003CE4E99D
MPNVREHYLTRERTHATLWQLFETGRIEEYVNLALGITDPAGNYSAAEHGLGPRILNENTHQEVFDLATDIQACPSTHHLPDLINRHRLPYLKISVGSEIAMMLRPNVHWVGNVRTIWSHLLIKHGGKRSKANQEFKLYKDGERNSEMEYQIWRDIYLAIEPNILMVGRLASEAAAVQDIEPGTLRFMWPDAVASFLYDKFANSR